MVKPDQQYQLFEAVKGGHVETLSQLLEDGANPNKLITISKGVKVSILHVAAYYMKLECVKILSKYLKWPYWRHDGQTALHWAVRDSITMLGQREASISEDVLLALIEKTCIHVNSSDHYGRRAIHFAAGRSAENSIAIVEWFLSKGAKLSVEDYYLKRPLHYAVESSTPEMVQFLVRCGASIYVLDSDRRTPLCQAMVKATDHRSVQILTQEHYKRHEGENSSPCNQAKSAVPCMQQINVIPDHSITVTDPKEFASGNIQNEIGNNAQKACSDNGHKAAAVRPQNVCYDYVFEAAPGSAQNARIDYVHEAAPGSAQNVCADYVLEAAPGSAQNARVDYVHEAAPTSAQNVCSGYLHEAATSSAQNLCAGFVHEAAPDNAQSACTDNRHEAAADIQHKACSCNANEAAANCFEKLCPYNGHKRGAINEQKACLDNGRETAGGIEQKACLDNVHEVPADTTQTVDDENRQETTACNANETTGNYVSIRIPSLDTEATRLVGGIQEQWIQQLIRQERENHSSEKEICICLRKAIGPNRTLQEILKSMSGGEDKRTHRNCCGCLKCCQCFRCLKCCKSSGCLKIHRCLSFFSGFLPYIKVLYFFFSYYIDFSLDVALAVQVTKYNISTLRLSWKFNVLIATLSWFFAFFATISLNITGFRSRHNIFKTAIERESCESSFLLKFYGDKKIFPILLSLFQGWPVIYHLTLVKLQNSWINKYKDSSQNPLLQLEQRLIKKINGVAVFEFFYEMLPQLCIQLYITGFHPDRTTFLASIKIFTALIGSSLTLTLASLREEQFTKQVDFSYGAQAFFILSVFLKFIGRGIAFVAIFLTGGPIAIFWWIFQILPGYVKEPRIGLSSFMKSDRKRIISIFFHYIPLKTRSDVHHGRRVFFLVFDYLYDALFLAVSFFSVGFTSTWIPP